MKIKSIVCVFTLVLPLKVFSQVDLISKNGFERNNYINTWLSSLNDTGSTIAGSVIYLQPNDPSCGDITAPQDCHTGRDLTYYDQSDGHAGFSFTKLDLIGNELPASAVQWSCVRDNVTGLVWEVKSVEAESIHYNQKTYRWGGDTRLGDFGPVYYDWNELVIGSNQENLCGFSDWKAPNITQLISLVNVNNDEVLPSIDLDYFPNTIPVMYWTANASSYKSNAVGVNFQVFGLRFVASNTYHQLRLVRFNN